MPYLYGMLTCRRSLKLVKKHQGMLDATWHVLWLHPWKVIVVVATQWRPGADGCWLLLGVLGRMCLTSWEQASASWCHNELQTALLMIATAVPAGWHLL